MSDMVGQHNYIDIDSHQISLPVIQLPIYFISGMATTNNYLLCSNILGDLQELNWMLATTNTD